MNGQIALLRFTIDSRRVLGPAPATIGRANAAGGQVPVGDIRSRQSTAAYRVASVIEGSCEDSVSWPLAVRPRSAISRRSCGAPRSTTEHLSRMSSVGAA